VWKGKINEVRNVLFKIPTEYMDEKLGCLFIEVRLFSLQSNNIHPMSVGSDFFCLFLQSSDMK